MIKDSLKNNSEAFEAYGDFARNYFDMREADFIGGDKYFHCKANYQATSRGWKGKETAEKLSSAREDIQSTFSGKGFKDTVMDHTANWYGRAKTIKGEVKSAREACEYFRPRGLPEKY